MSRGKKMAQSPRGVFGIADEPHVTRSLVEELRKRGPDGLNRLHDRYRSEVAAPERRAAIEQLLQRIQSSSPGDTADTLPLLVEFLYFAADQLTLAKHLLTFPAYNILDDYDSNQKGPWTPLAIARPTTSERWEVLGHLVDFPIGIGPCPLTSNSKFIAFWAALGYNVITYKSVRGRKTRPYAQKPHWVLLRDVTEPFPSGSKPDHVRADPDDWVVPGDPQISSANSFGIPSPDPQVWQADLELALQAMYPNQLLIVSVLGDVYEDDARTPDHLAEDFLRVAMLAYDAGARAIELNLSCPNLLDESGVEPPLCVDTELAAYVVRHVREHMPNDVQLVAKLAYLDSTSLRRLLGEIGGLLGGVSGINTLQCPVVRRHVEDPNLASDTFPGRREAGVSGIAIRAHALSFASELARLRQELHLDFDIIGMGGVTSADSFAALKFAGADVVQSVTGAFANPFLAAHIVDSFRSDLQSLNPTTTAPARTSWTGDQGTQRLTQQLVVKVLQDLGEASSLDVAAAAGVRVGRTMQALSDLRASGHIEAVVQEGLTYYKLASAI